MALQAHGAVALERARAVAAEQAVDPSGLRAGERSADEAVGFHAHAENACEVDRLPRF